MSFPVMYTANEPAVLLEHQREALARLDATDAIWRAVANQPANVQAAASLDCLDAKAVAQEWGVADKALTPRED